MYVFNLYMYVCVILCIYFDFDIGKKNLNLNLDGGVNHGYNESVIMNIISTIDYLSWCESRIM